MQGLRIYVAKRFAKYLGLALIEFVGIPGFLLSLPYLLRLEVSENQRTWLEHIFEPYDPFILICVILGVAWFTAYKIVKEDRKRHSNDFYSANSKARLQRAHHIFYHLYNEGQRANIASRHRDEWDKKFG